MPAIVVWALGAVGAVVLIKLFNREWQRVNDELDQAQSGAGDRSRARRRADAAARSRDRRVPRRSLKHDPEKRTPIFGQDHAQIRVVSPAP